MIYCIAVIDICTTVNINCNKCYSTNNRYTNNI